MAASMRILRDLPFMAKYHSISPKTHAFCRQIKQYCTSQKKSTGARGTTNPNQDVKSKKAKPDAFWDMMESRLDQASHSLLLQVPKSISIEDVKQHVETELGRVAYCFPYSQKQTQGNMKNYALIEMQEHQSVATLLKKSSHRNFLKPGNHGIMQGRGRSKHWLEINKVLETNVLTKDLNKAESISEQLQIFHEKQRLQEAEVRLRFLLCILLEETFQQVLPDCHLYPFGSSINGFGKRDCDVDMYLDRVLPKGIVPVRKRRTNTYELTYNEEAAASDRVGTQLTLKALTDFLRQMPQCHRVVPILHATCPLIKFKHYTTGLPCDLTADNRLGLTSTELLYIYGQLDTRLAQLVFFVRHWARVNHITNIHNGVWITNFPLTLLVIFFLQTRQPAVVPSLDYLRSIATQVERSKVMGVDTTFVGDISQVPASKNTQSVENLLEEFFHFCATFDFSRHALSIRQGQAIPNTQDFNLLIENPFETHLNTSKNVNKTIVELIRESASRSLRIMERSDYATLSSSATSDVWGIPLLCRNFHKKRRKFDARFDVDKALDLVSDTAVETFEDNATGVEEGGVAGPDVMEDRGHHGLEHQVAASSDKMDDDLNDPEEERNPTKEETVEINIQRIDVQEPGAVPVDKCPQLLHLYAGSCKLQLKYSFTKKNPETSQVQVECEMGDFKTQASDNSKVKAKKQAAKLMISNIPDEFVKEHLLEVNQT